MKDRNGNTICKKCRRRITSKTDKNFNPIYKYHSSKADLELCYHCVGLANECRCKLKIEGLKSKEVD